MRGRTEVVCESVSKTVSLPRLPETRGPGPWRDVDTVKRPLTVVLTWTRRPNASGYDKLEAQVAYAYRVRRGNARWFGREITHGQEMYFAAAADAAGECGLAWNMTRDDGARSFPEWLVEVVRRYAPDGSLVDGGPSPADCTCRFCGAIREAC